MELEENRKPFSNSDIKKMIVPLLLEQLLVMLVGVADTFMVSFAGDAAVSGVSLVNMFNTVFIYLFTALAAGGAVIVSQYIGSRNHDLADAAAGQLLMISTVISAFFMATRLGTSSPKIRVKKEITRVMRLTDTDCTASRGRAEKPSPSTSQAVLRLAKFSAAKAAPRKPARVMPI